MSNGEGVSYTVKELITQLGTTLQDMDRKLDTVVTRMELKAEKADVDALRAMIEQIRLVQAQAAPIDTRAAIDRHLQEPHSVAQKHEDRIIALERWKYAVPPALLAAIASIVIAILKVR
jgi:aminopeptidase N